MQLLVYHMQRKILYKTGLPSDIKKQAIVVARGKPAKIASKKQQVQFIQSDFFTNKPKVI